MHKGHEWAVLLDGFEMKLFSSVQVCLDLWDSLSVAEEGSMAWHCRQIRESDFVLVICSQGFTHRFEPSGLESDDGEADGRLDFGSNSFSSNAAIQLMVEEVCRAKASGQDLSKYMAAIFEYSEENKHPHWAEAGI